MDFKQLETFIEVSKLKSFSKAADKLFITQPTVTNHIQNLEKELDTVLINRMGKTISLTKTGELLYKNALDITNAIAMTKFELDSFKGSIQGRLDIISSSVPRKYLLPGIINSFLSEHPDVTFSITNNDSKEVVSRILDGEYDFGLVGAKHESLNLEYIEIMNDKLVLITPLAFREDLNNFDEISINEIIDQNLIFREIGSGTRNAFENCLKSFEVNIEDLKIVANIEDTESIKELVSLGTGLSFISDKEIVNDLILKRYKVLNLKGSNLIRSFYFVYHKSRILSPLGKTFKDFVLNQ
ncbi:MAG: selenium metabolism-associated LysR family transcriptional regulator [Tissierellia bacterium]|nr:selenium metabolism-associated LysR family transcriptional regulator [Tissierellia bacterium]MDD4726927.1 selenium metabolism-associated LysR family transcriptional regulator [Tissierellia bacterium]